MEKDEYYFSTSDLVVGYNKQPLISDINIKLKRGEILTLIGPNGGGKSTILKSICKYLDKIAGTIYIDNQDLKNVSFKSLSTKLSVVLTERIKTELMTCYDVVAAGRYPYTNSFGILTEKDHEMVEKCLERVGALDIKNRDFSMISDGQKQRIMLARAICQEPEIIILDEPTSFLDIRHKIELLDILHEMAKEENIAVIMSLHEIDLAPKISDYVMCVKGETIYKFGKPKDIFNNELIKELYDLKEGSYNYLFGSVELEKPNTDPDIFVISGGGSGVSYFRELQKLNKAFISGILYENDIDYVLATDLATEIIKIPAFEMINDLIIDEAKKAIDKCSIIIDTHPIIGPLNSFLLDLTQYAKENNKTIIDNLEEI